MKSGALQVDLFWFEIGKWKLKNWCQKLAWGDRFLQQQVDMLWECLRGVTIGKRRSKIPKRRTWHMSAVKEWRLCRSSEDAAAVNWRIPASSNLGSRSNWGHGRVRPWITQLKRQTLLSSSGWRSITYKRRGWAMWVSSSPLRDVVKVANEAQRFEAEGAICSRFWSLRNRSRWPGVFSSTSSPAERKWWHQPL